MAPGDSSQAADAAFLELEVSSEDLRLILERLPLFVRTELEALPELARIDVTASGAATHPEVVILSAHHATSCRRGWRPTPPLLGADLGRRRRIHLHAVMRDS